LDDAQQGFGGGNVGQVVLAVSGRQFQSVTACHRLTTLFGKTPSELVPVFPRRLVVSLLCQHLHHVNHREPPRLGAFVKHAADGLAVELGGQDFHTRRLKRNGFEAKRSAMKGGMPSKARCNTVYIISIMQPCDIEIERTKPSVHAPLICY
jgi:hypothetical protein